MKIGDNVIMISFFNCICGTIIKETPDMLTITNCHDMFGKLNGSKNVPKIHCRIFPEAPRRLGLNDLIE